MVLLNDDGGRRHGTKLSVLGGRSLSFPERTLALARGVVIGRGWAVSFFALVMFAEEELQDCRDEEQNTV